MRANIERKKENSRESRKAERAGKWEKRWDSDADGIRFMWKYQMWGCGDLRGTVVYREWRMGSWNELRVGERDVWEGLERNAGFRLWNLVVGGKKLIVMDGILNQDCRYAAQCLHWEIFLFLQQLDDALLWCASANAVWLLWESRVNMEQEVS